MKQQKKCSKKNNYLLGFTILSLVFNAFTYPTKAFIPYIYQPNQSELKNTGLSIAKTAAQLLQLGQEKEALRLAKLAVQLDPNDDRTWSILAEAQLRNQKPKEAKYSLDKAKAINPKKASLWFAEGALALQEKNALLAEKLIIKGLELEPKNPGAFFQLGNARIMQNKFSLALKAFKKATDIKPKFWEALNNQGLILFELGRKKEAIKTWRKVLVITKNAEPMLALATALYKTEKIKAESIELAREALITDPNYVSAIHQEEQLWGPNLRQAAQELFSEPVLISDVKKAIANSDKKRDVEK